MIIERYEGSVEDPKCSFCGEIDATAYWCGKKEIFCCKHCASQVIPQLMADAIAGGLNIDSIRNSTGPTVKLTKEQEILQRFHSAFSNALLHKLRS